MSGAKCNIEKTEIIPIGSEQHRRKVIETRKINERDNRPLEHNIRIANDRDAVRILGAWIGNKVNDVTPWEAVLEKIKAGLTRWKNTHPTLYGKRLSNSRGTVQIKVCPYVISPSFCRLFVSRYFSRPQKTNGGQSFERLFFF